MDSGSVYPTADSGGECGVAYETYFPMPTAGKDKPWYSIEQGHVHFTYEWMNKDMAAVNRTTTPWLIFTGHRPLYTSSPGNPIFPSVDDQFVDAEDLVLFGHVHNYERTCAVYDEECTGMPTKDSNGVDTYHNSNYTVPDNSWSLVRISKFGYLRVHATKSELHAEVQEMWMMVSESFSEGLDTVHSKKKRCRNKSCLLHADYLLNLVSDMLTDAWKIDVPNDVAAALRRGLLRARSLDESGTLLDETLEVALALR
ncbi:hypothetical protein SASPL_120237 [Salvia splendens]|uniref:Calcineurin-like phosphoesterase domain-containing protein n=1 Tax=Salvia splendens TaxID=180675 RepID=A0A8X8XS36_SALSN|nr:hypothetical protein SASPL_120237 [Salvia splendens]